MKAIKVEGIMAASKPMETSVQVYYGKKKRIVKVKRYAAGPISTPYGKFMLYEFKLSDRWGNYEVLASANRLEANLMPRFGKKDEVYLKIDSGCRSGEMYLDNTCTCRQQLIESMKIINSHGSGLLITIPTQEGRGHGFAKKYATLALQEYQGYDTYEAAKAVNRKVDIRDYYGVVALLKFFGLERDHPITVIANNRSKLKELEENGYNPKLKPLEIKADRHTRKHLKAKKEHLGEMVKI
ncbi:hypothetical protein M1373_00055 [Candidatus Marsarchaeota archaeon]|nr:hypothetical protein [Candidatus Marsarchaeota archaeon]MCL5404510.1 hypothetical protein [Candidatus Marsarchaeota archaeon]